MKKLFLALLFLLSIAGMAHAQNSTVVTVNTTDTQGTAWFGGTYSINFVGPQQVSWPGGSFSRNYSGSLNSIGSFALSLPSNTTITPTPNFWTITTCPFPMLTSASDFCVTQQFTITGATQTINLTPAAPQILGTSPAPVAAYSDAEIAPIISLGFIYYQIQTATTGQNRVCQVATAAGACTLWGNIGPGQPPTGFPRLDQVLNPNVDKSFDLGSSFLAFTNGPLDFTKATSLALPVAGNCVASANGQICFDSTALNWHLWSGADQFLATFPVASPPTSGDVSGFLLNAGQWTMQDLGPVNTLTGQSFLNLNMTTPIDGDIPCFDSTGPPYWNNCTAGTVATVISGATSTYTFALTDNQTIIEHDSAGSASVTATLPTADTLGFPAMGFIYSNHSTHADSLAPTTWTINGSATLAVAANTFCRVYVDTNSTTNWIADCTSSAASVTTVTASAPIVSSGGASPNISCPSCGTGSGSVSSVGLTVNSTSPSGIFTVTGSPVTTSGTLNFNLAGSSGGVPYFSSASVLSSSAALSASTLTKGGGAGAAPADSSVTDDGSTPTRTPNGSNTATSGNYDEWIVDTGGVTANKLACRSSSNKVQICATSTTQGVIGVAQATATNGQTVKVCWAARCSPISSNATTVGHWLIPSTTVAGDVDDTASATQPTGTQTFLAESAVSGGSAVLTTILAADTVSAAGGGKPNAIQTNGSTNQPVTNINSTTPAAGANNQNLTVQSSNSGNTTSVSVEVPIANTAQGGIISGSCAAGKALVGGSPDACISFPDVKFIPAANCNNTTAGNGWAIGSGGTVTCRAGTNNLGGYVSITDTSSTFATFQIAVPEDWDTGSNPYIRFQLASTDATNNHTIIPSIQVACYKGDGSTTDDVAANAAHSLSTTTLNGNANRFWSSSNVQMNSTDVTGCVAGALMQVTVGRATDTATNAEFYGATITFPRLITVQAN